MCDKKDLNNIITSVSGIYRSEYKNAIKRIMLYGSYARGDNTESSDIDLVAIVDGDRQELQQKLKYVWNETAQIGYTYNVIISPTVIPYTEFEMYKDTLPYYSNIEKEGIEVE